MSDELVKRLEQVSQHDWRTGILAHTPDTADEAKKRIEELEAALGKIEALEDRDIDGHRVQLPSGERFPDFQGPFGTGYIRCSRERAKIARVAIYGTPDEQEPTR